MIPKYPKEYKKFISDTTKVAKENGIKIRFINKEVIFSKDDKSGTSGYFIRKPLEIAVAYKGYDFIEWVMLFIHESCHMDQYLENKAESIKIDSSYNIFYGWLEGKNSFTYKEVEVAVNKVIEYELDCEKRSVEKIKKYNLPIDIKAYKKIANSYLYFIRFSFLKREWKNHAFVIDSAPVNFRKDYTKIPKKLFKAYSNYTEKN